MKHRTLKSVGWLAVIALILALGAAAGGGAVYAFSQNQQTDTDVTVQVDEPGLLVSSVVADSPAALAGLKRGDIILKINEQPVNYTTELISAIKDISAGTQVQLTVMHGDEERILAATLSDRNDRSYLGIVPCGGNSRHIFLDRDTQPGAIIINVVPDSPAAQAGLQQGDRITAVEGQQIDHEHNLADLIGTHAPSDTVTLTLERLGEEARQVSVTLAENPDQASKAFLGVAFGPRPHMEFFGDDSSDGDHFFFREDEIENAIVIHAVAEGSPAALAGLSKGSLITSINGQPITGPSNLVEAVEAGQPGDSLTLTIKQPDSEETQDVIVTLGQNPDEAATPYLGLMIGGFLGMHHSEDGLDITKELFFIPDMDFDAQHAIFELKDFSMEDDAPFLHEEFELEWFGKNKASKTSWFDGSI